MSDKKDGISPGDENLDQFFGIENDPDNEIPLTEEKLDLPDTTPRQHAEHAAAQAKKKEPTGLKKFLADKPPAVKYGLIGGLILIMVVVVAWQLGFFGGEEETTRRARKPSGTKKSATAPASLAPAVEEKTDEADAEESSEEEAEPDEPEEKPPLSDDFTAWSEEDYYRAKEEDHPQLLAAIGHLGEDFVGSEGVARGLTKLLVPPAPEEEEEEEETAKPPRGRRRPTTRRTSPQTKVIEPILAALAQNNTDAARTTLKQVLSGTLATGDDKTAALGALHALAGHPSVENNAILFFVLTQPEDVRGEGQGDVTAAELQAEALSLADESASPELRIQLARFLLQPTTPQTTRDALLELLQEGRPENVGAQIVLFASEEFDEDAKRTFEEYFTTYSSRALAQTLGVEPEESTGSGRRRAPTSSFRRSSTAAAPEETDPDLNYRLAQQLWSPAFIDLIATSLAKAESLDDRTSLVDLASTIPVNSMRKPLYEALYRVQEEVPKGTGSGRSSEQFVRDPGYLLVVKRFLDRLNRTTARSRDLAEQQNKVVESWRGLTGELLRAQCDRFHTVALARAEAARVAGKTSEPLKYGLPLKLHPDAEPVATYQLLWPGDARERLPGVAAEPMLINYICFEEETEWSRILSIYKRNLRVRDAVELGDSHWLETCRAVTGTDRWCSVDVLFTPAEKSSKPEEETGPIKLTIEIFSIEMKDPEAS